MELEGISCLPLDQAPASKKAIARSRSFGTPVTALDQLQEATAAYTASAAQALRKQGSVAACLQVSLETSRFSGPYYHKGITAHLDSPTAATGPLIRAAHQGLRRIFKEGLRYKRAGVLLTGLSPQEQVQLNL